MRAWIGRRVRAAVRHTGNRERFCANDRRNAKNPGSALRHEAKTKPGSQIGRLRLILHLGGVALTGYERMYRPCPEPPADLPSAGLGRMRVSVLGPVAGNGGGYNLFGCICQGG